MENLQASESRYRELDMPQEVMQLTKHQILSISVTAMLAHAQVQPESVIPYWLDNAISGDLDT